MTATQFQANRLFIADAQSFAHNAHDGIGQVRKYTGAPYWVHTDAVAGIVGIVTDNPDVIAAAHLHDVIEDVFPIRPQYNLGRIQALFGITVADLVEHLTDKYTREYYPNLNRKVRKQKEAERLAQIPADAQTVKLADLINNSTDIVANDPGFAVTYLREKEEILKGLTRGNALLQKIAWQVLEEGWATLGRRK